MKRVFISILFLSGALFVRGQGTLAFAVDQQATNFLDGFVFFTNQPMGQAFIPSQSSINAAAFYLGSGSDNSDVEINVRSGSITGTILGTSLPTAVPALSDGVFDFFFSSPVSLTPGTEYYLQIFALDGSGAGANLVNAPIPTGGSLIGGATHNNFNFWYQEGLVPEPSCATLAVLGAGTVYLRRRKRKAERSIHAKR